MGERDADRPYVTPYRLCVALAENTRQGGKVRQEHVAQLGAIDAMWLPSFFEPFEPESAARIKNEDWERRSAQHRFHFWKGVHEHLSRLSNRIDVETAARIMQQIHERVPMPTPEESASMELWAAEDDFDFWVGLKEMGEGSIKGDRHMIELYQERLGEMEDLQKRTALSETEAAAKVERLQNCRPVGDGP